MNENSPVFQQEYRIYLEDTDAGGIVYHANHLKLFERCRRDWLRQLGMVSYFYGQYSVDNQTDTIIPQADRHFVVSELSVRYCQPILLDSLVRVTVTRYQAKSASIILHQQIFEGNNLLASADITLACVQSMALANGINQIKPARLPERFLAMLSLTS